MKLRTVLIAATASLLTGVLAAQAQFPGVNSNLTTIWTIAWEVSSAKPTYSATVAQFSPVASASDVCTLAGSASKTIRVRRVFFNALPTTAVAEPVSFIKRSTVDTAGTSVVLTGVPYDSQSSAATAVAEYYTANGTLGTSVGVLADITRHFGVSTTVVTPFMYDFGTYGSALVLRGAAQQLAINLSGTTYTGTISCTFEWTEEAP
jgi:hypothetical protein